jgi:hypothetical protein
LEQEIPRSFFKPGVEEVYREVIKHRRVSITTHISEDGCVELIVRSKSSSAFNKDNEYSVMNGVIDLPQELRPHIGKTMFIYKTRNPNHIELFRIRTVGFHLQKTGRYNKKPPLVYPYFTQSSMVIPHAYVDPYIPTVLSFAATSDYHIQSGIIVATIEDFKLRGRIDMFQLKRYGVIGYRTSSLGLVKELVERNDKKLSDFMYNKKDGRSMVFILKE